MRQRSPGVDAEMSLAWLLEPLSVETFLDEIWGKDHRHITRRPLFRCPLARTVDGRRAARAVSPRAGSVAAGTRKRQKGPGQLPAG